ncbi:TetR/AcrR family transcriptional regulator [Streptomyces sp. H10-C2]|uniref:TetR/AcrR family transcriptional regulator n=1 Tax=unclassified Streptomyces TaxID=2593676 RepID=UPI0024B9ABE6|nr:MULTISPECIES: TetR/AcrR family transcriptional regulator [unclassified Streptomyces]MDJ0340755.1 TetR/AcrR family transcriptional regulator [Streptomyces sp. PH10-H1]MDJ0371973.1 TetR/AcrR family transcriptional regulator [Streptomyces sp. H10-C2]
MNERHGSPATGLRELKKNRTRQAISDAAIALFLERGFDQVPVAEVAAAAEVSKPTLFRYFPSKEDLALHRFADHEGEFARVVRGRRVHEAPLAALYRHCATGLDAREPVTGLNDTPEVLAFLALLYSAPSLIARLTQYTTRDQEALAAALREAASAPPGDVTPQLAAAQIIAAHQVLAMDNWRKLSDGRSAAEVHPEAVADLDRAFALLGSGLAAHFG